MAFFTRLLFLLLFIGFTRMYATGQAKPDRTFLETGKISVADLKMDRYEPDTSAGAVVLYDTGRSYFIHNLEGIFLNFDRHVVIKILKKNSYYLADVATPLYRLTKGTRENVSNLKAFTYNLVNGEIVTEKLTKEAIFEENNTDFWVTHKFTMPNVKEGSVIEYTYRVQSPFYFNFQPWSFQREIPILRSEYTAQIPGFFKYKLIPQGTETYAVSTQKDIIIAFPQNPGATEYHWVMQQVPALKEEPFMTTIKNYVSRMEFEFVNFHMPGYAYTPFHNSWERITKELLDSHYFGLLLNRTGFMEEALGGLLTQAKEPEQKMNLVYDYIKTNIKYNKQNRLFPVQSLRKAYTTKSGSGAEINMLLIAMLREAGLNAHPVILSTRDNGAIGVQMYPSTTRFNYVIGHVTIGEKEYLLDATEPFGLPNLLPERCLNGQGRLLTPKNGRWIALQPTVKASQIYQANLAISPDQALSGKVQQFSSGYAALNQRKEIFLEGEKKYIERKTNQHNYWDLQKFTLGNTAASPDALKIDYTVSITGQGQAAGIIYVNPLQNEALKENPFKLETRKFPVDFATPKEETILFTYALPDGYEVAELPENKLLLLPENGGRFTYNITNTGKSVIVMSKVAITRPVFKPEEYTYLKDFYTQVVAKHAEKIVLKKVK